MDHNLRVIMKADIKTDQLRYADALQDPRFYTNPCFPDAQTAAAYHNAYGSWKHGYNMCVHFHNNSAPNIRDTLHFLQNEFRHLPIAWLAFDGDPRSAEKAQEGAAIFRHQAAAARQKRADDEARALTMAADAMAHVAECLAQTQPKLDEVNARVFLAPVGDTTVERFELPLPSSR